LPTRKLDAFVREGWVKSVKFGGHRQSARLYHVADVEAVMDALAAGREPRRRGGKPGRKIVAAGATGGQR